MDERTNDPASVGPRDQLDSDSTVPSDPSREDILPGTPTLENVVFVLFGMLGTLWVYIHIIRLFS